MNVITASDLINLFDSWKQLLQNSANSLSRWTVRLATAISASP